MIPELLHLVPETLEWLYHNQPLYFHALVTFPIAFFVIVMPIALIAEFRKERRRDRMARELWGQEITAPTSPPFRRRNRLIDWVALIVFIVGYAAAVAYLFWAVGLLKL